MDGGDHRHHSRNNSNGGSRWNPTKEQISMLEGLYRQGLRTPTADQIQQITDRLKAYGHIEGKNVFYWFQNHKARQRQKQKQKQQISFAGYYNNHHHTPHQVYPSAPPPPPLMFFPAAHPNVVCSPYYIRNDHSGFRHQIKVQLPSPPAGAFNESTPQRYNQSVHGKHPRSHTEGQVQLHSSSTTEDKIRHPHQETLDLFPIHPTGILQTRSGGIHPDDDDNGDDEDKNPNPGAAAYTPTSSENNYDSNNCGSSTDDLDHGHDHHAFFDFFCRN